MNVTYEYTGFQKATLRSMGFCSATIEATERGALEGKVASIDINPNQVWAQDDLRALADLLNRVAGDLDPID